ncbi:DUF4279 domain-containing protein [Streptomyces sp. DSM 44917]|uniref:DUF4279 domain-containing protein n=1 Tax=Streptomyces boetiae TaxID=3075541 RepID=A0ABU2LDB3_9ACTN|nr:DUF4279 domain-containing protein [Streptomyces sp. DSM 44917]MDT0309573.1 DUF4279 domain-containing protein [Streptomyces sp. DSM 44917]
MPERVTERLGMEPTGVREPGPDRWRPGGDEDGWWIFQRHEMRRSLPEQVEDVLDAVGGRCGELRSLVAEGYEVTFEIFGFVGDGSVVELPAEAVARIAALGVRLEVRVSTSER